MLPKWMLWSGHYLRLCTWHMRRAVDRKLYSKKATRTPAYDLRSLQERFDFIREDFIPSPHDRI